MKNVSNQPIKNTVILGKQKTYNEVVEFLNTHWHTGDTPKKVSCIEQLDTAFGTISKKLNTVFVNGTNGKSITINFATKLLQEEGLRVGAFYSPHILTYNERFTCDNAIVANKLFTELANEVLSMAETLNIKPDTYEVLLMMALLHFEKNNTDIALLEVVDHPALSLITPKIAAITRVTLDSDVPASDTSKAYISKLLSCVKNGVQVISADQSKLNLQFMMNLVEEKNGQWNMPIRKLVALNYPFEQLHGRCAALAERITDIFLNKCINKDSVVISTNSLLMKKKGQRGRPTLEAKRTSELNPQKTIEQFWKENEATLPGRFQLLDKEKPTILLDNANNLDAFENLLLGIRLLHYKNPLKGLAIIIGCDNDTINVNEFLKLFRYFFKKTSGVLLFCPVKNVKDSNNWNIEKITNDTKSMKIKAHAYPSFQEAMEYASKSVDERNGLVVVTGSSSIITEYWKHNDIKKLS